MKRILFRIQRHQVAHYSLAVAITAGAGMLQWSLTSFSPGISFYIAFYPAVILAALIGRFKGGLLATLIAAILGLYFIHPHPAFSGSQKDDAITLALFLVNGIIVSVVADRLRTFQTLAEEAAISLRERTVREQALRKERDKAQQYLNIAGNIIVAIDKNQRVKLINEKGQSILKTDAKDIIGKNWFDHFIPAEERETVRKLLTGVLNGQLPFIKELEYELLTNDGSTRIVTWQHSLVHDEEGVISGLLSSGEDVTDRRFAEEALLKSEEQSRKIINSAPIGMILIRDMKIEWGNKAALQLFGTDLTELEGSSPFQYVPPERQPDLELFLKNIGEQKTVKTSEERILRADGTIRIASATAVPFAEDDCFSLLVMLEDITARIDAQNGERAAEDRILHQQEVLNAINLIFRKTLSVASEEELLAICLETAEKITASEFGFIAEISPDGLLHDMAMSSRRSDIRTPKNRDGSHLRRNFVVPGLYSRVLSENKSFYTNEPAFHPDSSGLPPGHPPITAFLGVSLTHSGRTIGMIGLANREGGYRESDLEAMDSLAPAIVEAIQRKRTLIALKQNEAKYRELLDNAQSAIVRWKTDGTITFFNDYAQKLFGYSEDELLGKSIHILVPARGKSGSDQAGRAKDTGISIASERNVVENMCSDGRRIWMTWTNKPFYGHDGRITEILGVGFDITDRKRYEEEIRSLNEELQFKLRELRDSNRELEAFVYSVTHDLRAPVRSIKGFSDLLLEDYPDLIDGKARSHLERIIRNAINLSDLIDNLLHLSRISRQRIVRRHVDMSDLVFSALAELQSGQPQRQVLLRIENNVTASADPGLLRIALANLLGNAWKFTAKKEEPCIEFGSLPQNGTTVFYVKDNGAGFDQEYADKLFFPFQRLHTCREFEGTGIGLALVERVVRGHGGCIWAEGIVGKGSCFYFTLN